MPDPALPILKAHWDLPSEGYVEPNRRVLIDLAFRLLATLLPGDSLARTRLPVSSRYDSDDYGGSLWTVIYRLGDSERGVEVTDSISDARDGMTPFEAATMITVYGLPDGWSLVLFGTFIAPLYGRPNTTSLKAQLPEAIWLPIAAILTGEFGATLDPD